MLNAYIDKYDSVFTNTELHVAEVYFPKEQFISFVSDAYTQLTNVPPILIGSFLRSRSFLDVFLEDSQARPFQLMTLFVPRTASKNTLEKIIFLYRSTYFFIDMYEPLVRKPITAATLNLLVLALAEIRTKKLLFSVFENYTLPDCYQFTEDCAKGIAQLTLAKAGGNNCSLHQLRQCIYDVFENHFDESFLNQN